MLKKKLEPIKRPIQHSGSTSNLYGVLTELVKQQKITNDLLKAKMGLEQINRYQQILPSTTMPMRIPSQSMYQASDFTRQAKINSQLITSKATNQKYDTQGFNTDRVNKNGQNYPQGPQSPYINQFNNDLKINKILGAQTQIRNQELTGNKKNYHIIHEFLPYTDRRQYKIRIDLVDNFMKGFENLYQISLKDLQQIVKQWTGDVFRMVASMCWNMLLNNFLTFDETKILFTENIIYNYTEMMKNLDILGYTSHKHHLTSLLNKTSINILDYLGKQYPQTKIDIPNIRLKQILPKVNNAQRLKFDLITIANKKDGFSLKYKKTGDYAEEIMSLINFLIDQTNQEYKNFEKQCLYIFQQVFLIPQKRDDLKNSEKVNESEATAADLSYRQKVKRYTKFLIGRKINKNVPKYTRQQINNGVFYPKSPSILRILTKWVEQLIQTIKNPKQYILNADNQLKSHQGGIRKAICERIIQKRGQLFKKIEEIKEQCFYIESILSAKKYTEDITQSHLNIDQISVGKFSTYLQRAISSYIYLQLNQILQFLLSIPLQIDEKKLNLPSQFAQTETRKQIDKLNLVTMKVFDLLRCKCTSNQQEIIWIMKYLIDKNLLDDFKLIRVKDRMNQGTRDIMCNLRFIKGGFISEMQLSVVSHMEKKQEQLDYYNHFLYELKRSKLGPLSENVSIWTVLEQKSLYFKDLARNPIPKNPKFHDCSHEHLKRFNRPISCSACHNFYPFAETCLSNTKCDKCHETYCGLCYQNVITEAEKKQLIFESLFSSSSPILNHITEHKDHTKPFPLQGIYFKKYHERRQINVYTILLNDSIDRRAVSLKSLKQSLTPKQNQLPIKCQLIFTHNAIRNKKPIEKQKNTKERLQGKITPDGKLFIQEKSYQFLKQYLIFGFDQKFQTLTMTLNEIQKYLKEQKNAKIKVLNIMEDPAYVDSLVYFKKRTEKIRQLFRLKAMFESTPDQKFLIYKFQNFFILVKVYKDPLELGRSIIYANNVAYLKQCAVAQKSIISVQKYNVRDEFQHLESQFHPNLINSLYKNLRKLYLNYNNLETIYGLRKFQHLEVLYMKNNKLTSLAGIEDMKDLMVLMFEHNSVQQLSAVKNLKVLRRILATNNRIKDLQPLRELTELRTLQFVTNFIESLEPVKDLNLLEDLNFNDNPQLSSLPLFSSKNIKFMAFSKTKIRDFSSLQNYPKIDKLVLQDLGLKEIPQVIKSLKLNELWLCHNEISSLQNLESQANLQILSLKHNKIQQVKSLGLLQRIKILYLDNNQINTLKGLRQAVDTLKLLSIKNNPLQSCKELMYFQFGENFSFHITKENMKPEGLKELNEIMESKINSSGSDD